MNLDENVLFCWAMGQYLPYDGFKWLNQKEIDKFDANSIECNFIGENGPTGYILKVDLEYLDEFHELYNDYPLAPLSFCCQIVAVILQTNMA